MAYLRTHLVIPDGHAHPAFNNDRAVWLGKLIADLKPEVVVNTGDAADMASLFGVKTGRNVAYRSYQADIFSHIDFQEKLWAPLRKSKRKMPDRYILEGNHEHRITRAEEAFIMPGAISFRDLELDRFYDETVRYKGDIPGVHSIDGCMYAHFFTGGLMGKAISSENQASYLLSKTYCTVTQGHTHLFDMAVRTRANGQKIWGTTVGCYIDYDAEWAGETNKLWDRGVLIKRNVEGGCYDPQWISLAAIKKEYGGN